MDENFEEFSNSVIIGLLINVLIDSLIREGHYVWKNGTSSGETGKIGTITLRTDGRWWIEFWKWQRGGTVEESWFNEQTYGECKY